MINIALTIVSTLIISFVITIIVIGLLLLFVRGCYPNSAIRVQGIIVAIITVILLMYQMTLFVGAIKAKNIVKNADIESIVGNIDLSQINNSSDVERFKQNIIDEYPYFESYVNGIDYEDIVSTQNVVSGATAIKYILIGSINYFAIWRMLWIIAFTLCGGALLLLNAKNQRVSPLRSRIKSFEY